MQVIWTYFIKWKDRTEGQTQVTDPPNLQRIPPYHLPYLLLSLPPHFPDGAGPVGPALLRGSLPFLSSLLLSATSVPPTSGAPSSAQPLPAPPLSDELGANKKKKKRIGFIVSMYF